MSQSIRSFVTASIMWIGLFGCGSEPGLVQNSDAGPPPQPPPVITQRSACMLSADCQAGTHCDLGECTQACNERDMCTSGKQCSARARCLAQGELDRDPPVRTTSAGTIEASALPTSLTDLNTSFDVTLTARSNEPVRYRVEMDAPHLRLETFRGVFKDRTTLHFSVNGKGLSGRDVPGTVRIHTTLGELVVSAPMHVGPSGSYNGKLRYEAGGLSLGDARIALDVLERDGKLEVRVDPHSSLLFPATLAGETTGRGIFHESNGLDVVLQQSIDPSFGAERNHFGRRIDRRLRLRLKPNDRGELDGTFDEQIDGLFATKTILGGRVYLAIQPSTKPSSFTVAELSAASTTAPAAPLGPDVFGWDSAYCLDLVCKCVEKICRGTCNVPAALATLESKYARPLYQTFTSTTPTGAINAIAFDEIAGGCQRALATKSFVEFEKDSGAQRCGLPAALACGLKQRSLETTSNAENGRAAVRLAAELLAPALLVAKNEIVEALHDSFATGASSERKRLRKASETLGPVTRWVLQPSLLEYLRNLSPQTARGGDDPNGFLGPFPAARSLADLISTESLLDGELARVSVSAGGTASASEKVRRLTEAQRRALLTYLEAVTVAELAKSWGGAKEATAHLVGLLTPLDRGFGATLDGVGIFGVPDGFVPFVYRIQDTARAPTNFEQMLAIAANAVNSERTVEERFNVNKRAYETGRQQIRQALDSVRSQYDLQIRSICGTGFDPNTVTTEADWSRCVDGQVGEANAAVSVGEARINTIATRMDGLRRKIRIDLDALAARRNIRTEELQFVSKSGDDMAALIFEETLYGAAVQALHVASNAGIQNIGIPFVEATGVTVISFLQADVAQRKQYIETANTMNAIKTQMDIDFTDSMASVQKQLVDEAELGAEISEAGLGVLELQMRVANLKRQAVMLFEERRRVLGTIAADPSGDPSFRLLRDELALAVIPARAEAQRQLYMAANALQYELTMSIGGIDGAVLAAHNGGSLGDLHSCLQEIFDKSRAAFVAPQEYTTEPGISLRKLLGVTSPRTDEITGETLSEAEQFRRILLRNQNLDGRGGVGIDFSTNLLPGNQLWPTDVCADRISTIQAQLVGDFLGDGQAQVNLALGGGSLLRTCDGGDLVSWSLGTEGRESDAFTVLQAGVNGWGSAPPNSGLHGQSVARASWRLIIPGADDAPSNRDVDLLHLDDILLRITHTAMPRSGARLPVDLSCITRGARK